MRRWNPFLRFPRASLVVCLGLCLPLLPGLVNFRIESELRVLLEGDQRNLESYQKTREILANVEIVVISLALPEVFTPEGLDAVRRISEAFEGQPGVTDVKSLTHSSRPIRRGLAFDMVPLVPPGPWDEVTLRSLRDFALSNPLVRNLMVAGDARHTLILATYQRPLETPQQQRQLRDEIESVLRPFRAEGLQIQTLALPLVAEEVRETLRSDVARMAPWCLVLLGLVYGITLQSGRMLVLLLLNQAAVLILLPAATQATGYSLSVFSIMLLPLLTGIHLTLLTHVYTSYQRGRIQTESAVDSIERVLRDVFKASVFAALTTVAGLGSLLLSEVRQVREFGWLGILGMGVIFVMTFGPGLSLLLLSARWLPCPSAAAQPDDLVAGKQNEAAAPADLAAKFTAFVIRGTPVIVTAALGLLLASLAGARLVRTDVRAVEFLNPTSPTRQAVTTLDQVYGGINVVRIEFDSGKVDGINDTGFLAYLDQVEREMRARTGVSAVYSYAQLLALMNQIWEGGGTDAFRLPSNPWLKNLFVVALKAQRFPFLTALADPDFRTAYLVLQTRDMPADQYLKLLRDAVDFAKVHRPPAVEISAAAGMHSILETDRRIMRSQADTLGWTAAIIGLVLALLWRSPRLGLLSLGINLVPVATVIAIAGLADMPLNSITVMVSAVALGIAVDDSIHFITHWRQQLARGATPAEAVAIALRAKGRPIIATSAALIAVFFLFALSSFPPVRHFGVLSVCVFAGALASVLILLPTLLLLTTRNPGKQR
jgi:hypothetical protein